MSGATKMYSFKFVGINKESLIIRCYQRYKYNFFEVGRFYRITNAFIKGSDTVWIAKGSTVGIRSPLQCGACPRHRLLLLLSCISRTQCKEQYHAHGRYEIVSFWAAGLFPTDDRPTK